MQLYTTKEYNTFSILRANRPINRGNVNNIKKSMQRYGFLPGRQILVKRTAAGKLVVVDGQHRLKAAAELDIPVIYEEVVTDVGAEEYIVAANMASKQWSANDYIEHYARMKNPNYIRLHHFMEAFGLSSSTALSAIRGHIYAKDGASNYGVKEGELKITEAQIFNGARTMEMVNEIRLLDDSYKPFANRTGFVSALVRLVNHRDYDHKRMVNTASKNRGLITNYGGGSDAWLEMLLKVYNHNARRKRLYREDFRGKQKGRKL